MQSVLCCFPPPCPFPPSFAVPTPCCFIPPSVPCSLSLSSLSSSSQSNSAPLFFLTPSLSCCLYQVFFLHLRPAPHPSLSVTVPLSLPPLPAASSSLSGSLSLSSCYPILRLMLSDYTPTLQEAAAFLLSSSVLHPDHLWQPPPLPSSSSAQEPTN